MQRDGLFAGLQSAHLRTVAEVDGDHPRMGGQRRCAGRQPQSGHLGLSRQRQRQRRRRAVLHHALRCGPRGPRIAVGCSVGGSLDIDEVGAAGGPCHPGGGDQIRQSGPLAGPHPDGRGDLDRSGHLQSPAEGHRLLGRQRHGGGAVHGIPGVRTAVASQQFRTEVPGGNRRPGRRRRHKDGVAQIDWKRETRCVVLGYGDIGDTELDTRRPVIGADGGDPHPRRLPVGQRHGQWPARQIEAQGRGAVGGGNLESPYLGADRGGTGNDGDRGVGHRPVEVDLQPLADRRLQRVGDPRGGGIVIHCGHRTTARRDVGQRRRVR